MGPSNPRVDDAPGWGCGACGHCRVGALVGVTVGWCADRAGMLLGSEGTCPSPASGSEMLCLGSGWVWWVCCWVVV